MSRPPTTKPTKGPTETNKNLSSGAPESIPALLQNLCVVVQAHHELRIRGALLSHHAAQTFLLAFARLLMVIEQPLMLFYEIPHHPHAEQLSATRSAPAAAIPAIASAACHHFIKRTAYASAAPLAPPATNPCPRAACSCLPSTSSDSRPGSRAAQTKRPPAPRPHSRASPAAASVRFRPSPPGLLLRFWRKKRRVSVKVSVSRTTRLLPEAASVTTR